MNRATLPDLMSLLPDTNVKHVVLYCLDTLGLTLSETERVLDDATQIIGAIDLLLTGRIISNVQPQSSLVPPESSEGSF